MSPPDKNIGVVQNFLGESVFGHVERCDAEFEIIAGETVFQRGMYPLGIYLCDCGFLFFVNVFVVDRNFDSHFVTPRKIFSNVIFDRFYPIISTLDITILSLGADIYEETNASTSYPYFAAVEVKENPQSGQT